MFSNTEFNHLKLKLDQLYLSLSGGKVNGETVFSKKVTFGSGDKVIKIYDGKIEGLDSPEGHTYEIEPSSDKSELLFTEDGNLKETIPVNTNFVGTRAAWNALTAAEKAKYLTMDFKDDKSRYYRDPTTGDETPIAINQTRAEIIDIAESSDVDTADNITTFTSSDTTDANANAWTSVTKLSSGEDHKSIFAKMSQMFKNVRYLYKVVNPIGTIVNGKKLTGFSIGGSGSTGNVAKITLTKGVWVVSVSTWPPVGGNGAFSINYQALGWAIANNMHTGGCGIINCTSNSETFYLAFTNWSGSTATNITMDYFRAVRIK